MKWSYQLLLVMFSAVGVFGTVKVTDAAAPVGKVTIVSYVDIVPDAYMPRAEEKAAALFRAQINATQKDKGLVSFVVFQQVDGNNHFTMFETWADSKAYAAHVGSEHTIGFRRDIQSVLGSPFDARMHQEFK